VRSLSVAQASARNAIGNSLAAADFMGRTMGEGAMPQIAIKYPNKMSQDQTRLLRENFVATYTGTGARKLPLVLTEGGSAETLSISPADMELMMARGFERNDICDAFGVPSVLVGSSVGPSTWPAGIEQVIIAFVRFTIAPMVARWDQELNRKIYRRAGTFLAHDLDALQQGDTKACAEADRSALGGPGTGDGYLSVDDVRRRRNLPALGGDYAVPFRAQRATDPSSGAPAK
jgi:HK97 family phage portal protein